jgi:preprotein translocase subunit SecB
MVEINIISKFHETNLQKKKSNFEITYTAIVRIDENITDKKGMEKIILSDVPSEIYPRLEDLFITLVNKSGFPEVKIERKVDFEKLYKEKFN